MVAETREKESGARLGLALVVAHGGGVGGRWWLQAEWVVVGPLWLCSAKERREERRAREREREIC